MITTCPHSLQVVTSGRLEYFFSPYRGECPRQDDYNVSSVPRGKRLRHDNYNVSSVPRGKRLRHDSYVPSVPRGKRLRHDNYNVSSVRTGKRLRRDNYRFSSVCTGKFLDSGMQEGRRLSGICFINYYLLIVLQFDAF
jgi:hypothetical protein